MKDTVIWNIEEGRKLTGPQIGRAENRMGEASSCTGNPMKSMTETGLSSAKREERWVPWGQLEGKKIVLEVEV